MTVKIDDLHYKKKRGVKLRGLIRLLKQCPVALLKKPNSSNDAMLSHVFHTSLKIISNSNYNYNIVFWLEYWGGGGYSNEMFYKHDVERMWITQGDKGNIVLHIRKHEIKLLQYVKGD